MRPLLLLQESSAVRLQQETARGRPPVWLTPNHEKYAQSNALQSWITNNRPKFLEELHRNGSILIRDFNLDDIPSFEKIALSIEPKLASIYQGTSPRNAKSKYVFTASEFPSYYPVMQHCEMSFLNNPPSKLFFFCKTAPKKGGETPTADFRKVYKQLDLEVRKEFETKGVEYIRNYDGPLSKKSRDLTKLKRWDEVFSTTNRKEVEEQCKREEFEFSWGDNDRLTLINRKAAIRTHPITGHKAWFNHVQSFHISSPTFEYKNIAKRQKGLRSKVCSSLMSLLAFYKLKFTNGTSRGLHVRFGNGEEIPVDYIRHLQETIWNNMLFFQWQKGDLLVLDNLAMAHGRMPYQGDREILVAWG